MIDPKVTGTKIVFGPCRLSYVHLFDKYNPDNTEGGGKYCTNILIPKTETKTIKAIEQAIAAAKTIGISKKWQSREPKKLDMPLRDGDDKERDVETYAGHLYLNAKSKLRPVVVDSKRQPITNAEDMYSGVWGYVGVSFYPYSVSGSNGIGAALDSVMKFKDDEKLGGGGGSAADFDFVPVDTETDDEL